MLNRIAVSEFQFHNGTINTKIKLQKHQAKQCFNSTTVQLIRYILPYTQSLTMMFQFHNGTINTWRISRIATWQKRFQFHNGTINTQIETNEECCKKSFNSTTVQLIPDLYPKVLRVEACFNSTTVQLILCPSLLVRSPNGVSIPQRYN